MNRRAFITLVGGATAWPLAAHAQPSSVPVIGFLRNTPAAPFQHLVVAFRQGLNEEGLVEGSNVAIDQRWADNDRARLEEFAADLIRRRVAVIVANGPAAAVVKPATATTPIVFVTGEDPIKSGLVNSINRPGGNATGVTFLAGSELNAKRIELLHELAPNAALIAVLGDPNYRPFETELPELMAAASTLGRRIIVLRAATLPEVNDAFDKIVQARADALLVSGSPFFTSQRGALVALAARHAIPAVYDLRDLVVAGGLISYSASITNAYRQAGVYAGRILKGAKPGDLPVLQPTTFELVINLKTAKALGLTVPPTLLARADEVIE